MKIENDDISSVLLIDDLQLRGVQITCWLTDWANANNLELLSMTRQEANQKLDVTSSFDLVLFSVGGTSLLEPEFARPVRILHALCPQIPFVVLSDVNDRDEIASAIDMGAAGYLPSVQEPELALRALTFILHGGSYFPPSALRKTGANDRREEKSVEQKGRRKREGQTDGESDEAQQQGVNRVISGGKCVSSLSGPDTALCDAPKDLPTSSCQTEGTDNKVIEGDDMPPLTQRQQEVLFCLREGQPNKVIARSLGMSEATVKVHLRDVMRKLGVKNRTQAALWRGPVEEPPAIAAVASR